MSGFQGLEFTVQSLLRFTVDVPRLKAVVRGSSIATGRADLRSRKARCRAVSK